MLILKEIIDSFSSLIYPPICLHCHESLEKGQPIFCSACLQMLELIDPQQRCPYCFSSEFNPLSEWCCVVCQKQPPLTERMASAFDYDGPAVSLITHLKYGGQVYLAEGAGAFLAAQFMRLEWPFPDVIVPMPISSLRRIERGYNQSQLIAEALAKILNRPIINALHRHMGDFSQAGLNHHQRMQLTSKGFALKESIKLHDKTVLLIDDVMTTGSSLRCCAEALQGAYPQSIYALTVCRAI